MRQPTLGIFGLLSASIATSSCATLIGADFDQPSMAPDTGAADGGASEDLGEGSARDVSTGPSFENLDAALEEGHDEELDASPDGETVDDADACADTIEDPLADELDGDADASLDASQPLDADTGDAPWQSEEGSVSDDVVDAATDISEAQALPCEAGTARCMGNGRQTCTSTNEWSVPVSCPSGMPNCAAGECVLPPSCEGSLLCGPTGSRKSCCDSIAMDGGTFGRPFQDKVLPATVDAFRLDRYEVTVGRFRQFVANYDSYRATQGEGEHPNIPNSGWQVVWLDDLPPTELALRSALSCPQISTWTDMPGANEEMPIDCVGWFEAFLFCIWDGGRLPTDAEWSYAATGGGASPYPWGTALPDHSHAVYGCGTGEDDADCGGFRTLAVGSKSPQGDALWGHADLSGNVWEWVLDGDSNPGQVDLPLPCSNCARLATSAKRNRGGGWWNGAALMQTAVAYVSNAPNRHWDMGFRCARNP